MNSAKALPLYLNISLLCYPSVNKWKTSNTTIDLLYTSYGSPTLSFEALQRPTKFLKTFTDALFLTTILALVRPSYSAFLDKRILRPYVTSYDYRKGLPADTPFYYYWTLQQPHVLTTTCVSDS